MHLQRIIVSVVTLVVRLTFRTVVFTTVTVTVGAPHIFAGGTVPEIPPFRFDEVGAERGIAPYFMARGPSSFNMGGGIAAADFDDDGDVDMFIPNDAGHADQLYRNLGGGSFEEIASAVGLADLAGQNRAALWFDYNGDGKLDLVVTNDAEESLTSYRLYRQGGDGFFEDVTVESEMFVPIAPPGTVDPGFFNMNRSGMCAADFDNNGYLDLCAPIFNGRGHLFMNKGDGTFDEVGGLSGVFAFSSSPHQVVALDFNADGWMDIYQSVDFSGNNLWLNQRDGSFVESSSGVGALANNKNDMGIALGDVDNDGDFDIYVTGLWMGQSPNPTRYNVLMRNDSEPLFGELRFVEISQSAGVRYGGWGWGTTFLDGDNDGLLDLAATNGSFTSQPDPSVFYWNRSIDPIGFADASDAVAFNDTIFGSCLISFDYDRDGDLDLVQSTDVEQLRLLENETLDGRTKGNYLVVQPRMDGPNHFAIGATVRIEIGEQRMTRLIQAGTSYLGQEPAEAFFGIGNATGADRVEIEWPGGMQTAYENIDANQVLRITETDSRFRQQRPGDINQDGLLDISDAVSLLSALFLGTVTFPCGEHKVSNPGNVALLDWQPDGSIDITDVAAVLFFLFQGNPVHPLGTECTVISECGIPPACD